jgi:hypothetical protein
MLSLDSTYNISLSLTFVSVPRAILCRRSCRQPRIREGGRVFDGAVVGLLIFNFNSESLYHDISYSADRLLSNPAVKQFKAPDDAMYEVRGST